MKKGQTISKDKRFSKVCRNQQKHKNIQKRRKLKSQVGI